MDTGYLYGVYPKDMYLSVPSRNRTNEVNFKTRTKTRRQNKTRAPFPVFPFMRCILCRCLVVVCGWWWRSILRMLLVGVFLFLRIFITTAPASEAKRVRVLITNHGSRNHSESRPTLAPSYCHLVSSSAVFSALLLSCHCRSLPVPCLASIPASPSTGQDSITSCVETLSRLGVSKCVPHANATLHPKAVASTVRKEKKRRKRSRTVYQTPGNWIISLAHEQGCAW